MDAKVLQRKRQKENGCSSKGKQAKSSAVRKAEVIPVKAKRKVKDAVIDLSDSPEQPELQLLSPKRVTKQVQSSPAVPSPSKYKVYARHVSFHIDLMCGVCVRACVCACVRACVHVYTEHTFRLSCCMHVWCSVYSSESARK